MFTVIAHKKYLDFSPVLAWARDRQMADKLFATYRDNGYTQVRLYEGSKLLWGYDNPAKVSKEVKNIDFGGMKW